MQRASGHGAILDGWQRVRLGEHLTLCRNGLVSRQDANPDEAIPITRIETIADGKIDWSRVGYVPLEDADLGYLVQIGDILLSHINSVKHIGKVARMSDDDPLLHGMNLMLLRFRESLDTGFGYALMSSANTKIYMERRAKKAVNQASINRQDIFELPILLPPLPEQRAIAAVLDSIDEAIEGAEAVIAATGQLRNSLLHDLLTRGVPGWHTEWKNVPGLGTMPADWEVVRLGEVGQWYSGGTPSKAKLDYWEGPIPWVSPKDMKVREINDSADSISEEAAEAGSRIVPAGSILIVVRGMILAHSLPVAITGASCAFNQDIRALIPGERLDPRYVLAAMESLKAKMLDLVTPSTHGTMRIVSEDLQEIRVLYLPCKSNKPSPPRWMGWTRRWMLRGGNWRGYDC